MAQANRSSTTPPDPIYAAIDRHRTAVRLWAAAATVSAAFPDGANPMTLEQQAQIDAAVAGARLPLIDAGLDLIETAPTTVEGHRCGVGIHTGPNALWRRLHASRHRVGHCRRRRPAGMAGYFSRYARRRRGRSSRTAEGV